MLHLLSVDFCPYGMRIIMESIVFNGASRCLIIKFFWVKNALIFFPGFSQGQDTGAGSLATNRSEWRRAERG
jgi:hypothetical protein